MLLCFFIIPHIQVTGRSNLGQENNLHDLAPKSLVYCLHSIGMNNADLDYRAVTQYDTAEPNLNYR